MTERFPILHDGCLAPDFFHEWGAVSCVWEHPQIYEVVYTDGSHADVNRVVFEKMALQERQGRKVPTRPP